MTLAGPFDEAAKIIEIDGLHVIVSRFDTLCLQARNGNHDPREYQSRERGPMARTTEPYGRAPEEICVGSVAHGDQSAGRLHVICA